jgi:hypothetical protein
MTHTAAGEEAPSTRAGMLPEDDQRAFLDLLDAMVLTPNESPVAFARVRRREGLLQEWYGLRAGWRLQSGPSYARLIKVPDRPNVGMGALSATERRLGAREYAIMTWVLWHGERGNLEQTTLTTLAKEVFDVAAEIEPHFIDWAQREHRASFVLALRTMVDHGWLVRIEGSEQPYAETGDGDVLYNYTSFAMYAPVHVADDTLIGLHVDHDWTAVDVVPAADRDLNVRVYRQLLLTGVILAATDPGLHAHVCAHAKALHADLRRHLGWHLEITPGYAALLRPHQQPRWNGAFPTSQARMAIPMLLTRYVRDLMTMEAGAVSYDQADDTVSMSLARLEAICEEMQKTFGSHWTADQRRRNGTELAADLLEDLRDWKLGEGPDALSQVRLFPTLGRYDGAYREDGIGLGSRIDDQIIGDGSASDEE